MLVMTIVKPASENEILELQKLPAERSFLISGPSGGRANFEVSGLRVRGRVPPGLIVPAPKHPPAALAG